MEKRWYIIHAYSGFERKVKEAIIDYINRAGKSDCLGEIFIPTEEVVEMKNGKKKITERKIFPGYVLIEMLMNEDNWHLIKSVPHVMGFIGGKKELPTPIPDFEVQRLFNAVDAAVDAPKPKIMYSVGEIIRVIGGPFNDFEAMVKEVNYEKNSMEVDISIFGRSTSVNLDFNEVKKV